MMKKINIIALLMLMVFGLNAQNLIDKHFSEYTDKDNFIEVNISGNLFKLLAHVESDDADAEEMMATFEKIEGLRLIAGHDIKNANQNYISAIGKIENDYEELMNVDSKEGKATFFIDEKDGVVQEVVCVASGDNNFVVVSIYGVFDMKEVGNVIKKVSETQKDHFDVDLDFNDAKVYPNPSKKLANVVVEVPTSFIGGNWTLFDINGKKATSKLNIAKEEKLDLRNLNPGNYYLLIQKDDKSIKKKIVVQ